MVFENGTPEERLSSPDVGALAEFLARFVTESANPQNRLGVRIAVRDALQVSLTAQYVPESIRGIRCGAPGSANAVGDLVSSMAVGFLWTAASPPTGFGVAAGLMAVGTITRARLRALRFEATMMP